METKWLERVEQERHPKNIMLKISEKVLAKVSISFIVTLDHLTIEDEKFALLVL